jgi:hypothetical protein
MLETEKLRKADIFSGCIISLFGLWVVIQALKMPMKGSWGGVQNVWFVSPALFPLFVGAVIVLLGIALTVNALKTVGLSGLADTLGWLKSAELFRFLKSEAMMRFHAIVVLLFSFVFLNVPRIDFFLSSILFLTAFITMFYLDNPALLLRMLRVYLGGTLVLVVWFASGLAESAGAVLPYASDWLTLIFLIVYGVFAYRTTNGDALLRKKYKTGLILSLAAPFTIGPVFKYFLLVPMPTEGLIVVVMDAIRYWDF